MAGRLPIGDTGSAQAIVPVVAGTPFDLCRGLLVGTAGAATVVDGTGATRTLIPLQQGYNPISITNVVASGLTADDIWALY